MRNRFRRALELAVIVAWVAPVLIVLSLVDRAGDGDRRVGPTGIGGRTG